MTLKKEHARGQHATEYLLLIGAIAVAATAGVLEIRRALNAKTADGVRALADVNDTFTVGNTTVNFGGRFKQYESYATQSNYITASQQLEQRHVRNGVLLVEKVADVSARKRGGETVQATARNMGQFDAEWNNTGQ